MITPEKQRASVLRYMTQLHDERFWGQLILRFRDGELVVVEPRSTIPIEKFVSDQLDGRS